MLSLKKVQSKKFRAALRIYDLGAKNSELLSEYMISEQKIFEHSHTEMIESIILTNWSGILVKILPVKYQFWMDRPGIDPHSMRILLKY